RQRRVNQVSNRIMEWRARTERRISWHCRNRTKEPTGSQNKWQLQTVRTQTRHRTEQSCPAVGFPTNDCSLLEFLGRLLKLSIGSRTFDLEGRQQGGVWLIQLQKLRIELRANKHIAAATPTDFGELCPRPALGHVRQQQI